MTSSDLTSEGSTQRTRGLPAQGLALRWLCAELHRPRRKGLLCRAAGERAVRLGCPECAKALTLINATQPTKINLKEGNIEIMLDVLDGDVAQGPRSHRARDGEGAAETIDSINGGARRSRTQDPEERHKLTDLENGLTHIAQNIQGFAEEADPDDARATARADEAVEEQAS